MHIEIKPCRHLFLGRARDVCLVCQTHILIPYFQALNVVDIPIIHYLAVEVEIG